MVSDVTLADTARELLNDRDFLTKALVLRGFGLIRTDHLLAEVQDIVDKLFPEDEAEDEDLAPAGLAPQQQGKKARLKVECSRNDEGLISSSKISFASSSTALKREETEALLALNEHGVLDIATFKKVVPSWSSMTMDKRIYTAMQTLRSRLKEIGLEESLQSKRGYGFFLTGLELEVIEK